jgi:DNA repair protein RadA/Sms
MEETVAKASASATKTKHHTSASQASRVPYSQVKAFEHTLQRQGTGMEEFDRVLGGGMVLGSVNLIGGEPGIGKSTLLTHLVLNLLENGNEKTRILYIAGEESPEQIAIRIQRMWGDKAKKNTAQDGLIFVTSTDVDEIVSAIEQEHPTLVIIDSIQSLSTEDLVGATGSIGQLKECTERITRTVKPLQIPTFLVGHVTKDGAIAGPKVLEHIVDAVLELSGERTGQFRLLRAIKNRFGATDEVGVFRVVDTGLSEVSNPSQLLLEERQSAVAGSAIAAVMEGTRPLLVEIQALVIPSQLAMPRRVARGISLPRIQLLAAVLEKHCRLPLGSCDIFVNVAGGLNLTEPGVDLAIAVAIASSQKGSVVTSKSVFIGEVGLLGEVRQVSLIDKRTAEAKRLGFTTIVSAKTTSSLREALKSALG